MAIVSFTADEKNFIVNYFKNTLETKRFCYISSSDVSLSDEIEDSEDVRDEKLTLLEILLKHNLNRRLYNRKIRKAIFEVLKEKYPNLKETNFCVHFPEIQIDKVTSVSSFLKIIENYYTDDESQDYFYRGQCNFSWNLTPGIYRKDCWIKSEKEMMDEMTRSCPSEFNFSTTFDILAKLHHYGLPTRLIDVTSNPLVALYFACADGAWRPYPPPMDDGKIYMFTPKKENIKCSDSDTISILSNIAKMEPTFGLDTLKEKEGKEKFLHNLRREKAYFGDLRDPETIGKSVFVLGNNNNKRIAKQNGSFLIVGVKDKNKEMADIPEEYFAKNKDGNKAMILVDHDSKYEILNELKYLGIHEGTLFPEIETMAKYIKKKIEHKVRGHREPLA